MPFCQKTSNKIAESKWPLLSQFIMSVETSHRVFSSWQEGKPTSVFLCLHFLSDLNCQSSNIFVPFVKTPLFFLFPVAVSFLLLKKIRNQCSLGLMEAGLIDWKPSLWPRASLHFCAQQTMEIISGQPTLAPSAEYNPQKNFCHPLFCAGATTYWMLVSTTG